MSKHTASDMNRVFALYEPPNPQSARRVAEITGIPFGTVSHWLDKHDKRRSKSEAQKVRRRREEKERAGRIRRCIDLYGELGSMRKVAKRMGRGKGHVQRLLNTELAQTLLNRYPNR